MNQQSLVDSWKMFQREHDISIDRLVCSPLLRQAFVDQVSPVCGSNDEQSILWVSLSASKGATCGRFKRGHLVIEIAAFRFWPLLEPCLH